VDKIKRIEAGCLADENQFTVPRFAYQTVPKQNKREQMPYGNQTENTHL
jgi:hypothetical protein